MACKGGGRRYKVKQAAAGGLQVATKQNSQAQDKAKPGEQRCQDHNQRVSCVGETIPGIYVLEDRAQQACAENEDRRQFTESPCHAVSVALWGLGVSDGCFAV